jgi:hypothetical protein
MVDVAILVTSPSSYLKELNYQSITKLRRYPMSWDHRPWETESRQREQMEWERREWKRRELEEELRREDQQRALREKLKKS